MEIISSLIDGSGNVPRIAVEIAISDACRCVFGAGLGLHFLNRIIYKGMAIVLEAVQHHAHAADVAVEPLRVLLPRVAAAIDAAVLPFAEIRHEIRIRDTNAAEEEDAHDRRHVFQRGLLEAIAIGERTDFDHQAVRSHLACRHLRIFHGVVVEIFRIADQRVDARIACLPQHGDVVAIATDMRTDVLLQQIMAGENAAVFFAPCRDLAAPCLRNQFADKTIELRPHGIRITIAFKQQRQIFRQRFAVHLFILFKQAVHPWRQRIWPHFIGTRVGGHQARFVCEDGFRPFEGVGNARLDRFVGDVDEMAYSLGIHDVNIMPEGADVMRAMGAFVGAFGAEDEQNFMRLQFTVASVFCERNGRHRLVVDERLMDFRRRKRIFRGPDDFVRLVIQPEMDGFRLVIRRMTPHVEAFRFVFRMVFQRQAARHAAWIAWFIINPVFQPSRIHRVHDFRQRRDILRIRCKTIGERAVQNSATATVGFQHFDHAVDVFRPIVDDRLHGITAVLRFDKIRQP